MTNLPKEGESQRIGRLAKKVLAINMPLNWIDKEQDGDSDFGIDYLIQLKNSTGHVEFSFYLQLKGTTAPAYNTANTLISYDFKTSTLEYYHRQEPLVMVAVVDICDEKKLYECPIYYLWLDDNWFAKNHEKLVNQKSISINIPKENILDQDLDIYDFYASRFQEKLAFNELKKGITEQEKPVVETLSLITQVIDEKPIFLKSIELQGEAPWIDNPKGAITTELKTCSDFLTNNRIKDAKEKLTNLETKLVNFTDHELAEFYYQKGNLLSREGYFDEAESQFELAQQKNQKNRYRLAYLESKFKLDSMPAHDELQRLVTTLSIDNFHECALKAKALAILRQAPEALDLLKKNHPTEILIQMIICTIGQLDKELDEIIEQNLDNNFIEEREQYIFNALSARRYFHVSSNQVGIFGEILPIEGKIDYDLEGMKKSFVFLQKAWQSAQKLGYPSDVTILMDISCLVYGYFNKFSELCSHLERILIERPNHIEIIRQYIRILFNCEKYKEIIEIIEKLNNLDVDESGIKILSYYHLGKSKQCLELIGKYEHTLLANPRENTSAIFCIGIEIAEATFQKSLAEKYKKIVKTLANGEAFMAIQNFVSASNMNKSRSNEFAQDLYQTYLKLGKPFVIAEQLLSYLDPHNNETAHQVIELAEKVLSVREIRKNSYLDLAQAFFTTERWEEAEKLAEKNIAKGIAVSKWKLVQAAALQNQGKVGIAYKTIEEVINSEDIGREEQEFFISLSLSLGLIDKVVDLLEENLANSTDIKNNILIIRRLIAIYINRPEYGEKLKSAILKYGTLIDQNNCEQEGDYLHLCLLNNPFNNNDDSLDYRQRLEKYIKKFPNSSVLKCVEFNPENGIDGFIETLNQITGVTAEQIELWESNKQKLRKKELPIPFCMRGNFLQNTRDVYTTWLLSKSCKEEELEFKIVHSYHMDKDNFFELIDTCDFILFDETSLLILNELNLLDIFLASLSKFYILQSSFNEINLTAHEPISINNKISISILKSIQNNIEKLQLVEDKEYEVFKYDCISKDKNGLLLTEDLYLSGFIRQHNPNILCANIFNILEFFLYKNILSQDVVFEKVVNCFLLGIVDFNVRFDFLGKIIDYYLCKRGVENYEDTNFKNIFDKLLAERKGYRDKQKIFLDMFGFTNIENLSPNTLLSLISKLLEENSTLDPQKVINTWFIYCGLQREIKKDVDTSISKLHEILWFKYKEVTEYLNDITYTSKILLEKILAIILRLDESVGKLAFNNLRASFSKDSKEYQYLESFVDNSVFK
ncbi:Uncharacterised protein [Acinetobacter baumannii]|uniref:DUF4365 domain-containing protein n=1 Tax=Acinetobacter baumannii TaxID=470 RepID=UPI000DE63669|nr:DUF4365 domain-containing protein [Acinetobacter baumannii]SSO99774.1 Uncharacterised protein [Acinetobacter baumannii]